MRVAFRSDNQRLAERELIEHSIDLLSQQIWCWGRDILRPDGNWLLETGFTRTEPPADREKCSSVYTLELPQGRRVILRGFGIFYGEDKRGGIFLPRFEFRPRFTTQSNLYRPPWLQTDLPELSAPDETERDACASLTLGLIDWVQEYEATVAERLGVEYRQATINSWNIEKQTIMPAEEMACAWRSLGAAVAENFQAFVPKR
ncbi:MAG: hypothetical protein AAGA92_10970 [Planctomycetota bacterium]